jgi:hypothetical protein
MTTMTSENKIQQLIDRYMAGETSPTDERELARLLEAQHDLPTDWAAVRAMLGELTLGELCFDRIVGGRRRRLWLRRTAWAAAACAAIVLALLFWPSDIVPTKPRQVFLPQEMALTKACLSTTIDAQPTTVPPEPSRPMARTPVRQERQPQPQPTVKEEPLLAEADVMDEAIYLEPLPEAQIPSAGELAMSIRERGERLQQRISSQRAENDFNF